MSYRGEGTAFRRVILNECREKRHEPDDLTRKKTDLALFTADSGEAAVSSSFSPFKRSARRARSARIMFYIQKRTVKDKEKKKREKEKKGARRSRRY
jgi:hypothetical protein